jgi:lipoprotein-releasing system permease protein
LAQELLEYKSNQISGIEIKETSKADEAAIIEKLQTIFNNKITVKNRAQLNEALYKMLNTENTVYLIFTLVIVVALFNLIGALIMMILDKKSELKKHF